MSSSRVKLIVFHWITSSPLDLFWLVPVLTSLDGIGGFSCTQFCFGFLFVVVCLFLWIWQAYLAVLKIYAWLCAKGSLLVGSYEVRRLNPGWLLARQVYCPLYYHSSPLIFCWFAFWFTTAGSKLQRSFCTEFIFGELSSEGLQWIVEIAWKDEAVNKAPAHSRHSVFSPESVEPPHLPSPLPPSPQCLLIACGCNLPSLCLRNFLTWSWDFHPHYNHLLFIWGWYLLPS